MPFYLGVDQSLTSTGVALIDPSQSNPVELFNIDPKPREDAARLCYIRDRVASAIKGREIFLAAIEGYSYGTQVGRVFELGEIGGVLRSLFFDLKIPYSVVAPVQLKKFATGKPSADKEAVMAAIQRKWGLEIDQDDQADAFVLAKIAELATTGISRYREELEVIHALKNKRSSSSTNLKARCRTARISI